MEDKVLNLTVEPEATEWDNSLLSLEHLMPNKTDALAYLDGNGPEPTRYAHALIVHRASEAPYYQDLIVGPLPFVNGTTKWEPLTFPYTRKTQGKIRNLQFYDDTVYEWLFNVSASILDITLDLWNGSALGLPNDTMDVFGIDPLWQDEGIYRWDQFWNLPKTDFDCETLLPLGLCFKTNVTGRDASKWKLEGWLYNDVSYNTTEDFRKAYYSPGFEKLPPGVEGAWADSGQRGAILPMDTSPPPTQVAPSGSRFYVNATENFVKWMDFEFYTSFSRDTGLRLCDIKYKGQRIIYELGLQEALAHYAGNDPVQSGTSYLDSFYGFGPFSFQVVKGYDCPSYATYLNSTWFRAEVLHTHIDSICLFEQDAEYPIQRHSTSKYISVTKNIFFTVRNVCTVGNYDYMFSYEFYVDGSIHIEVRASGYIRAAYWAKNHDYGYHIHDALSGSMHDHVLNYKVDFDILGTENTMVTTKNVPVSQVYPWSAGKPRNTMKIERGVVASEDESKLFWGYNGQTQFKVVNIDETNPYGEWRGYRILPSEGTIHLTVQNSSNLVNAANWATHDIYVTKQKDTEPRSAHPYNSQDVANPMVNFNDFFDGDNLTQTDIVVWFNLGMHHLPHTGDLPNTVFSTAHSGMQIMPLNYLLGDPSRETTSQVRINYHDGVVSEVATFGAKSEDCSLGVAAPDLYLYKSDICIREFPYNATEFYRVNSIV